MHRVIRWGALVAIGLATLGAPAVAQAEGKSHIEWVRVDVPERNDAPRLQKMLKQALGKAAKKANFGSAKTVNLSVRVMEMTTEEHGDVIRITCTVMGRVVGGAGARSRISYGGSPDRRDELEKEVLTQVANGLVGRLAQIVRTQAHPPVRLARRTR